MKMRKGFTLMEVLAATVIAGLTITAGFRLIAMSYSLLSALDSERELISAAQKIWLAFRTEEDMSDNGHDDKNNIKWESKNLSVPIDDDYELKFKQVTITAASGRETVIYIAE